MTEHHDYTRQPISREPDSPQPKGIMPAGLPHAGVCRYPVEIAWTQSAQEKWERLCAAATWTERAQTWLYGLTAAIISIAVTISIASGTSCRAAGAQEERLNQTHVDVDGLRIIVADQAKRLQEVDERQTARYERLLEITSRIDARQAAEEASRQVATVPHR